MKTSWIHLGRKEADQFKTGRALEMISGLSGEEVTNDETDETVHDLVMCDRMRDCEALLGKGYKL
jgi:hypothetical protein